MCARTYTRTMVHSPVHTWKPEVAISHLLSLFNGDNISQRNLLVQLDWPGSGLCRSAGLFSPNARVTNV